MHAGTLHFLWDAEHMRLLKIQVCCARRLTLISAVPVQRLPEDQPSLDIWTLSIGAPCLLVATLLLLNYLRNLIGCHRAGAQW